MGQVVAYDTDTLDLRRQDLLSRALGGDALCQYWLCPWLAMSTPDPWQKRALQQLVTRQENVLMCCTRGAGKTETFGCAAYIEACLGGFAMILSRSNRQAMRIISRAWLYAKRLGLVPVARSTMHEIELQNGGRVLALPCSGDTIVGEHGITLLGIDEAARITDAFYAVVTPMLSVSEAVTGVKPRTALLSTPFGQVGFFYREWQEGRGWARHKYTWRDCPRIKPSFVEAERQRHGDWWVRQEYECEFLGEVNSVFPAAAFGALVTDDSGEEDW